jgi:23S rRNA pseudouridine2605 synthase
VITETTRLNKYLALALGVSRREADDLIVSKKVQVNDEIAILGTTVTGSSIVSVNGKVITTTPAFQYVALHKPVGYVCSRKPQGDNPTIYSLLPADMAALKLVGRLDKDSSGIILLTNDGDFAHHMTHPSFKKIKVYEVELSKPLAPLHQQMISDYGVEIGDGVSKLMLERIDDSRLQWTVTMHEGRNRQIRRTFSALGYDVKTLHRTHFGTHRLEDLAVGTYQSVAI